MLNYSVPIEEIIDDIADTMLSIASEEDDVILERTVQDMTDGLQEWLEYMPSDNNIYAMLRDSLQRLADEDHRWLHALRIIEV